MADQCENSLKIACLDVGLWLSALWIIFRHSQDHAAKKNCVIFGILTNESLHQRGTWTRQDKMVHQRDGDIWPDLEGGALWVGGHDLLQHAPVRAGGVLGDAAAALQVELVHLLADVVVQHRAVPPDRLLERAHRRPCVPDNCLVNELLQFVLRLFFIDWWPPAWLEQFVKFLSSSSTFSRLSKLPGWGVVRPCLTQELWMVSVWVKVAQAIWFYYAYQHSPCPQHQHHWWEGAGLRWRPSRLRCAVVRQTASPQPCTAQKKGNISAT